MSATTEFNFDLARQFANHTEAQGQVLDPPERKRVLHAFVTLSHKEYGSPQGINVKVEYTEGSLNYPQLTTKLKKAAMLSLTTEMERENEGGSEAMLNSLDIVFVQLLPDPLSLGLAE